MVEGNVEKPIDVMMMEVAVAALALRTQPKEQLNKYVDAVSGTLEEKYKGDELALRYISERFAPAFRRLLGLPSTEELIRSRNPFPQ